MKAGTMTTVIALSSLMAVSGTVQADANDAYRQSFYGDSGMVQDSSGTAAMGKAAFGTPATTAFAGPQGGVMVLTHNGLARWPESAPAEQANSGKAAFGSDAAADAAAIDSGRDAYHRAFFGD